jgi:hypothetical protein
MIKLQEIYNKDVEWLIINTTTPPNFSEIDEFEAMMKICLKDGMTIKEARDMSKQWVFGVPHKHLTQQKWGN